MKKKPELRSITRRKTLGSLIVLGVLLGSMALTGVYSNKQAQRRRELESQSQKGLELTLGDYQDLKSNTNRFFYDPNQNTNMPFADNFDPIEGEDHENTPVQKTNKIQEYSHPVTGELVQAVIKKESQGDANVTSCKGAAGIMQLMPETWKEQTKKLYGKSLPFIDAYIPQKNIEVGTNYLKEIDSILSKRLKGYSQKSFIEKQSLILAGYNGGPSRLIKKEGDISKMPKETREYVSAIMGVNQE